MIILTTIVIESFIFTIPVLKRLMLPTKNGGVRKANSILYTYLPIIMIYYMQYTMY
jgi:hypothetical protein